MNITNLIPLMNLQKKSMNLVKEYQCCLWMKKILRLTYYEAVVSNVLAFLLVVMSLFVADVLKVFTLCKELGR